MSGKIQYVIEKLYRGILASVIKIKRKSSIAGFNIQMYIAVGNIAWLGEYA
jgi:polygalacturonase